MVAATVVDQLTQIPLPGAAVKLEGSSLPDTDRSGIFQLLRIQAGYLIASSQGNNTFAVYTREGNNAYVKSFRIVAGNKIDEVTETDGIHVTTPISIRTFQKASLLPRMV